MSFIKIAMFEGLRYLRDYIGLSHLNLCRILNVRVITPFSHIGL